MKLWFAVSAVLLVSVPDLHLMFLYISWAIRAQLALLSSSECLACASLSCVEFKNNVFGVVFPVAGERGDFFVGCSAKFFSGFVGKDSIYLR